MTRLLLCLLAFALVAERPNIILVMSDDQGWGQVGYRGHSHLRTPHLDAMARNGLRFERFYAGASNCSPTRATVLTGRSNDRTGVQTHGYPLRLQEHTVARALRDAGYVTGHFGKWHLNGLRGPGVPILKDDSHSPGAFGFDTWFSVTNFFDRDPLMSRQGEFEQHQGDSSEVTVAAALDFIRKHKDDGPLFAVIWYGSPHSPMIGGPEDLKPFAELPAAQAHQLAELVAMDRSVGTLRAGLRDLGIADNTLLWFNSDNGGLPKMGEDTVGGLRGFKNSMYEGGLRVPGIIEWPAVIKPRVTHYPAGTVDIFPTIAEIAKLPNESMLSPTDGISLRSLFAAEIASRSKPLFFRHNSRGVIIDNDLKLLVQKGKIELYDLIADARETTNLAASRPEVAARLKKAYNVFDLSVETSVAGKDYPGGKLNPNQPQRRFWRDDPAYAPYAPAWLEADKGRKSAQ
jgi:arylsulfatase A-like enzyme